MERESMNLAFTLIWFLENRHKDHDRLSILRIQWEIPAKYIKSHVISVQVELKKYG